MGRKGEGLRQYNSFHCYFSTAFTLRKIRYEWEGGLGPGPKRVHNVRQSSIRMLIHLSDLSVYVIRYKLFRT